jgi:threonylcarbamoyladenosine tRNA methylthiotransferase MtaB
MSSKVVTFGCRLNTYESEQIKYSLDLAGIKDAIIVNTCAVTAEAERQARQTIRKLYRENPNKRIIVTGCSANVNKTIYQKMPEVSSVMTNEEISNFLFTQNNNIQNENSLPVFNNKTVIPNFEGRSRAFIPIQTGCDNYCSFCLIRIARGRARSFPIKDIIEQARIFADNGYLEITLTGVNVSSFLYDGQDLGELIRILLAKLQDKVRLRLSSLDPADINDSLLNAFNNPRLLPHLHLSAQSGDDEILRKMLRRHTRKDAEIAMEKIRKIRPDIVLGADILCNFPTETEEMFENTCDFVKKNEIALIHVFNYSDRPGTVSEKLVPKVPKQIAKERARKLIAIRKEMQYEVMKSFIGRKVNFLIEKEKKKVFFGKIDHFLPIFAPNNNFQSKVGIGNVCLVTIMDIDKKTLSFQGTLESVE